VRLALLMLCLAWAAGANAQARAVTPIYGQLVMFSFPAGFKPAHANDSGSYYIQESVLDGQTVEKWTQMITVTGSKGLAAKQGMTPQRLLETVAAGFQRACPTTFTAVAVGNMKISGQDASIVFVGCGSVQSGAARSESALLVAIKGASDYYTIQWAERGALTSRAPQFDADMWLARLKKLQPIKVCARIPGEAAPYQSCINQKE
jgi:hypothetical protein